MAGKRTMAMKKKQTTRLEKMTRGERTELMVTLGSRLVWRQNRRLAKRYSRL